MIFCVVCLLFSKRYFRITIRVSNSLGPDQARRYVFFKCLDLGDICIQNFHLGRYIVGYTVGNLVLRRRVSGAIKRDFQTYIRRYTSPNETFEYGYPLNNALLTVFLKKTVKMNFNAPLRPVAASCIKPLASCIYSLVNQ